MVNCQTCKRAFRSRIGKTKNTRCEGCANLWRELQLREDEQGRKERSREMDIIERELELKNRQLELEKQKITIKESLPRGGVVELTCFYDDQMQDKIQNLLKGAHMALPSTSYSSKNMLSDRFHNDFSTNRSQGSTTEIEDSTRHRKVHFPPDNSSTPEFRKRISIDGKELPEFRKPRKLPTLEGVRSRLASRHKLEDEGSSFGSGGSVD